MGRSLYEDLKSENTATEVIRLEGEEEMLTSTVMLYASREHL